MVCLPQKQNECHIQPEEQKIVGRKHNVLKHYVDASAPNPEGVVLSKTFK